MSRETKTPKVYVCPRCHPNPKDWRVAASATLRTAVGLISHASRVHGIPRCDFMREYAEKVHAKDDSSFPEVYRKAMKERGQKFTVVGKDDGGESVPWSRIEQLLDECEKF